MSNSKSAKNVKADNPSAEEYLQEADDADVTHFPEDDNPTKLAGDFLDDDEEVTS